MTFGERLTQLRREAGFFKRTDFAKTLGIPSTTLRNYERDVREPSHLFIKKITDYFNVSADYLLCLTDTKTVLHSFRITCDEELLIKKYRKIDISAKKIIDFILDMDETSDM